jgi:hypothetical protein
MFRRNFFSAGPWDGSRPTVRLAGRPNIRLGQQGDIGCKIPGTEIRPVFNRNPTTGVCGVFWISPSTTPYPDCVQAPPEYPGGGYQGWIPPECGGAPAPTPEPEPTPEIESTPTSPQPSVPSCCQAYWEPSQNQWYATCQAVKDDVGQGYDGPVNTLDIAIWTELCTPVVAPSDYYPVGGQCPEGQTWNGQVCAPSPEPIPAPAPPPVTKVSPGASVPIVPGPFPVAPAPTQVPIAPQQFGPPMRPACKSTPYKTKMFPSTTVPTRPDAFGNGQQWTS